MEYEKLLSEANIPKELWDYCEIKNGTIYVPSVERQIELGIIDNDYKQIDICPESTTEERITKLEEEKSILAENVYQLASILEIMLGGTEDGQTEVTTTDTAN